MSRVFLIYLTFFVFCSKITLYFYFGVFMENKLPLSGNMLKILAALFMTIDHIGLLFFPHESVFRIVGRLAFPIFAFMIAEGARYTKNRLKYFLQIFILGVICQIVYYIADGSLYMCILITFSLSLLILFALKEFKIALFEKERSGKRIALTSFLLIGAVALAYIACEYLEIDYGFGGVLCPVFASIFDFHGVAVPEKVRILDRAWVRVLTLGLGVLIHALTSSLKIQIYALYAIILLMLYSGERGKYKMKYFFYLFYPLHLVLLYGLAVLVHILR